MTFDGTYGSMERDTFPELVTITTPLLNTNFAMLACRYPDGRIGRKLMTCDEWLALSEDDKQRLTHKTTNPSK